MTAELARVRMVRERHVELGSQSSIVQLRVHQFDRVRKQHIDQNLSIEGISDPMLNGEQYL